jgi:LDH2 family malate/lactate/ureidoglycolate dehydrogenase
MLHLFNLGVIFLIVKLKIRKAEQLVYKIFSKVTFEEYARYLAEEIADSKVDGHSDHGLQLIPYYVKLAKGEEVDIGGQGVPPINPKGKVEIHGKNFITVNGNMTFGQVVLSKLVSYLAEKRLDYYI